MNRTARAIDLIPKDVVINDWHYERADPTAPYFAAKGFRVVTCPWKLGEVAVTQIEDLLRFRRSSTPEMRDRFAGVRMQPARVALVTAFVLAAAGSSLLALVNTPVGPRSYSPGLTRLSSNTDGQPTLILAPPRQVTERHGRSFLGWELRGARPVCVTPDDGSRGGQAPPGVSFVIVSDGSLEPPFEELDLVVQRGQYVLWEKTSDDRAKAPKSDPNNPTDCTFADTT